MNGLGQHRGTGWELVYREEFILLSRLPRKNDGCRRWFLSDQNLVGATTRP
jgi:hypothetical protein